MNKADGTILIDTKIQVDDVFDKGVEKVKDKLEDIGDSSKEASESIGGDLSSGFKKLGKAIAAAGVVDMLMDFGKEAIELGSDLEEVQNVVDVTFETMSDSVNQFARDAQKSAGLSETMAKQYVGTFGAMADSFGFTEQEAYEMSTALTQLTGDVASFYNLSQEEAATKLKGVFTGETEALKELGVVMTQTALDSYAMANGFGKTTSAMNEQEKVALRYQFVMDQLSAASGDFVRTQDSWANQSKVLSLQWESLMATLGSGLIDALTPGIQFLNNTVLPLLQDVADGFAEAFEPKPVDELRKAMKDTEKTVDSANKTFNETSESIELNAIKAELYKDQLIELEEKGLTTAESQMQYANAVNALNEIYPELNLTIAENTGLLDANSWAQLQNLETMKQRALAAAQMEQYNAQVQAWAAAENAVIQAETNLSNIQKERQSIEALLQEQTGLTIEQLYELYNAHQQNIAASQLGNENAAITASLYEILGNNITGLTGKQSEMLQQIIELSAQESALTGEIEANKTAVAEQNAQLEANAEAYGIATDAANDLADGEDQVAVSAEAATQKVDELQQTYLDAKESARASIDAQVGLFAELKAESELTTEDIVANWKSQQEGFDQYKQDLQKAVELHLDETLVKQLSDGSEESMAILHNLVTDTDLNVEEFNAQFQATEEARETVSEMMAGIQTDLAGRFSDMYSSVSGAWGDMDDVTREAINSMMKSINSLKGKTIYITTKYQTSGSPSGSSSRVTQPTTYTADVPYLASGAVIPPNAPFMAVLGDQKHGTNIEAPLSTIQEAVANVMSNQLGGTMAGFEAVLNEIREFRKDVQGIELGDATIGQAANRYNGKLAIMRGW